MSNWWIDNGGTNTLKGVEGDPANPIKLPDNYILNFLGRIPKARHDFNVLFPTLLPEEQARLLAILEANPFIRTKILTTTQDHSDRFASALNAGPIRTVGPLGGKRIG